MSVVLRGISGNLADVTALGELKIAGTITATATNPSIGLFGDPVPLSGTTIAGPDGSGNLRAPAVLNSTPAGTEYALLVRPIGGSGGGVANLQVRSVGNVWTDIGYSGGNLSVPVDIRNASIAVTGTFWQATQPVSGTFWQATQPISAASLPLPTGAATEATLANVLTTSAFQARIPTIGQQAIANSLSIAINSDQVGAAGTPSTSVLSVQGVGGGTAIAISAASLPLPTGAATEATLGTLLTTSAFQARIPVLGQGLMAASIPVVIASNQSSIAITAASLPLPTGAATEATLGNVLTTAAFQARIPVLGQALMAASIPVTLASNQSAIAVTQSGTWNIGTLTSITNTVTTQDTANGATGAAVPARAMQIAGSDGTNLRSVKVDAQGRVATYTQSGTANVTRVPTSTTSANLLAANTARKGVVIVNESSAVLFVKYGATASSASYTYRLTANGVLVIDFGWTGTIDAILSTGSGNAQITELLD